MFSLIQATATLSNANMRAEIHGEENKLAADLKLEIQGSNEILELIEPGLLQAMYRKAEPGEDAQSSLDLADDILPKLRFPLLAQPLKSSREFSGYTFVMHYGIDEKSDVKLGSVKVNSWAFEMQDGGSVKTTFRVVAHPETDHEISMLCKHIQQKITFSLTPPDADYGDGQGAQ